MDAKDLRQDTRELINRHTRSALRRAEQVAGALRLPLHVQVRAEADSSETWGGAWHLTFCIRVPGGWMVRIADYRVPVGHVDTPALFNIFMTDLTSRVRARVERVQKALDRLDRGEEP